jgi:hypothetical protein
MTRPARWASATTTAYSLAAQRDRARTEVDGERADDDLLGPRPDLAAVAADHGADPRQQLARLERLGDVVVGAALEPADPVVGFDPRRDHDDRYVEVGP